MEIELSRHDWPSFTGRGTDTAPLPAQIRRLFTTTDAGEADEPRGDGPTAP